MISMPAWVIANEGYTNLMSIYMAHMHMHNTDWIPEYQLQVNAS